MISPDDMSTCSSGSFAKFGRRSSNAVTGKTGRNVINLDIACTQRDVSSGSRRYSRMCGRCTAVLVMLKTDRFISWRCGSVTTRGFRSVYTSARKVMWTLSNTGSCSNVPKRRSVDIERYAFVCNVSSVTWGKVWDPRNAEIPRISSFFECKQNWS